MTKMEKLDEVKKNLTSVLNELEVYIFTEDADNILTEDVSKVVEETKTVNKTIYT